MRRRTLRHVNLERAETAGARGLHARRAEAERARLDRELREALNAGDAKRASELLTWLAYHALPERWGSA